MTITCHQFLESVSDYLDHDLDPALAQAVREHSRECPPCLVILDTTRQTVRLAGDQRLFAMPAGASERLRKALEHGLEEPLTPTVLRQPAVVPMAAARRSGWSGSWMGSRSLWAAAVVVLAVGVGVVRWHAAATTTSGWLMDRHCLTAFTGHPQDHKRDCLLRCAKDGYGVVDAKGHFTPFDSTGNRKIEAALQAASAPDHIWVTVHAKRASASPELEVEDVTLTQGSDAASR